MSSPLDDLEEPLEEAVVLRLRALCCLCGDCCGRGPSGTRLAFPLFDLFPGPGLFSSGSFLIVLVKPEDEGPVFIPAAIAPNRFCKGACDPLDPFSVLMRAGSIKELGLFERFLSLFMSPIPGFLPMYSGEEERLFRLRCGEGDDPELREEPEDLRRLSPLSLLPFLPV